MKVGVPELICLAVVLVFPTCLLAFQDGNARYFRFHVSVQRLDVVSMIFYAVVH